MNAMHTQAPQAITPELRHWIQEQLAKGCRPQDMAATMRAAGWAPTLVDVALGAALPAGVSWSAPAPASNNPPAAAALRAATTDTAGLDDPAHPAPAPDLAGAPTSLNIDGHVVGVVLSLKLPRVVVFSNFLTHAECDELVAQATPRMARSQTVVHATGDSEVNPARTSEGMFFERGASALIERVESRIAGLLHWPVENGEGLQVLRYRPGAEYRPHYDYFDPAQPGTAAVLRRGGQRVGTLVMYLNTPEAGGATTFPDAGLDVAPQKGCAVFFAYPLPVPASRTLHGGAQVIAGEKWVATKWLRQGAFA